MKFLTAATAALILGAEAVLASPMEVNLVPREPRRRSIQRVGHFLEPSTEGGSMVNDKLSNSTKASYSTNWSGAVLVGSGYTSVYGKFKVPTPKLPPGGSSSDTYSASAWVGLDGDTCQTAILQTGVDFTVSDGGVSYDAWYEWIPDNAYNFNNFKINGGDEIGLTATATSTGSGYVIIDNLTSGKSVRHNFSNTPSQLCETNAEWIVEDFEIVGQGLIPLVDFGTVVFENCSATTGSGTVGVDGAEVLDIRQSGVVYTDCSLTSSSSVECLYV